MNNENKLNMNNLVSALLFLVLGIILLTTNESIITLLSKVIGGVVILSGIIKIIIYIYMKGKVGNYDVKELILGLFLGCIGILFILFSSTLGVAIRLIVGIWTLFAGINKIIFAISVKSNDKIGFRTYLLSSIIMILVGIVLISGLFKKLVGLFIIIYAVAEIIDYIYYISSKNYTKETKTKSSKKIKKLKDNNDKVVDAIVEEEKNK